ncbi:MAG: beta-ketoacyl synthase N-terminal-like domain-containing protein [Pseudomonadota bacterium]
MSSIKNYILQQVAAKSITQEQAKKFLAELGAGDSRQQEPIAIIGMSGRFPKAENVDEFWQLLRGGVNCIDDYPTGRRKDNEPILRNPYYTEFIVGNPIPEAELPNAHARAGYLQQIDKFDAAFFGIPPAEATYMDPSQRIALEAAWTTMEDAGYGGDRLFGSKTGVYIGKEHTNYSLYRYCSVQDPMQLTGSWESVMASRISFLFNFRGPCMVVDTACSAGLVSVHMACSAIRNGECDTALAGGINITMGGELRTNFQGGMKMDSVESDDGVIRTFDAKANGTVWGEGVVLVMLKPLNIAVKDGDHIYGVIKGSAINNDGASNGLTAPNAEAQEEVILQAWKNAGINPENLSYIEAHGTGTVLGDPIEFKGLSSAFRRYTERRQFCAIGSLKTNMGHLVAASGCASLIKVLKQLQHQEIAPTINFNEPNHYINFHSSPLFVNDRLRPWDVSGTRYAAISSFGFSHTNCHMVIEEAPKLVSPEQGRQHYCFTVSAKKQSLLLDYLQRYQVRCSTEDWNLADLCYTANIGRGAYSHRVAIITSSTIELRTALEQAIAVLQNNETSDATQRIFYGKHVIVSDKKTQREAGEITDKEKKSLTETASSQLTMLAQNPEANLTELARLFCLGADVDWRVFYQGERRLLLSVPSYPFEKSRFWADPKLTKIATFSSSLHPLVNRLHKQGDEYWIFESEFNIDSHWVLADHKIKGVAVVPGTTYLEMVRFVACYVTGWQQVEFNNIFFLQPMVVAEKQTRRVRISVARDAAVLSLTIISQDLTDTKDDGWQTHVEGKVVELTKPAEAVVDLVAIKATATETIEDYVGERDTGVFQFGIHWDTVRSVWTLPSTTLAKLVLPTELQTEIQQFLIHPSVLDNAMNLISQIDGQTYLPFLYKSFRLFAPFTAEMYTYIKPQLAAAGGETQTYNVVLCDNTGRVLAEIDGYVTKRVHSFNFNALEQHTGYLATRWIPLANLQTSTLPGSLVLVNASSLDISAFAQRWSDFGVAVRTLELDSSLVNEAAIDTLVKEQIAGADAVVYIAPVNLLPIAELDVATAETYNQLSVCAIFHLLKSLVKHKVKLAQGLNLVTTRSFSLTHAAKDINPFGAAAAKLLLSAAQEIPDLKVRVLDQLSVNPQVAKQLFSLPTGKLIVLHGEDEQAYCQELFPRTFDDAGESVVAAEGVYIITGGLGGLGLAAANYIAQHAKAHVVLLGRSPLAPASEWGNLATQAGDKKQAARYQQLVDLQSKLASVNYFAIDISDAAAVNQLIAKVAAEKGAIRGVFHLAGVAGDGYVMRKDFSTFAQVLAPKITGTLNLLRSLAQHSLDFIYLYSSITALTADAGQSDYAAANAFMDAVASSADNIIAVNWSNWSEVGMAVDFGIAPDQAPFTSIATEDAFKKLHSIHKANQQSPLGPIIPGDINPPLLVDALDSLPFVFSSELHALIKRAATTSGDSAETIEVDIRGKSKEDLSATETVLAKIFARILGLSEVDVFTNFLDMGGNSLIATHLLRLIDEYYPGVVDISDIFSYPSIEAMGEYIDQKHTPESSVTNEPATNVNWEDMLDQVLDGNTSIDDVLNKL